MNHIHFLWLYLVISRKTKKKKKEKNRQEDGRCMERRMGSKIKHGLLEEKIGVQNHGYKCEWMKGEIKLYNSTSKKEKQAYNKLSKLKTRPI